MDISFTLLENANIIVGVFIVGTAVWAILSQRKTARQKATLDFLNLLIDDKNLRTASIALKKMPRG